MQCGGNLIILITDCNSSKFNKFSKCINNNKWRSNSNLIYRCINNTNLDAGIRYIRQHCKYNIITETYNCDELCINTNNYMKENSCKYKFIDLLNYIKHEKRKVCFRLNNKTFKCIEKCSNCSYKYTVDKCISQNECDIRIKQNILYCPEDKYYDPHIGVCFPCIDCTIYDYNKYLCNLAYLGGQCEHLFQNNTTIELIIN